MSGKFRHLVSERLHSFLERTDNPVYILPGGSNNIMKVLSMYRYCWNPPVQVMSHWFTTEKKTHRDTGKFLSDFLHTPQKYLVGMPRFNPVHPLIIVHHQIYYLFELCTVCEPLARCVKRALGLAVERDNPQLFQYSYK